MRKLFGVVLIIFSGLIALGSVFPLLDMLSKASHFEPDFEHKSFFLIGSLLAFGVICLIAYLFIYAGLKLYNKK
ncbi:MAG: hypothetical protein IPL10_13020 [Bacteroidetes bacterium]|nr:hypothetical protein [Bacteroidota bacterium]